MVMIRNANLILEAVWGTKDVVKEAESQGKSDKSHFSDSCCK